MPRHTYIAISGKMGANDSANAIYQGSFNFSDLGMSSDENFQRLLGRGQFLAFNRDFNQLWRSRQSRAPSPTSNIAVTERSLGTGRYVYMEPN